MYVMRAGLTILAAAMLLTTEVIGQAPARLGVLIGIRADVLSDADATLPSSTYRTYWVVKDGSRVQLAATADNLIVPRPDGFWRIGSRVMKWRDVYSEEYVWASSAIGRPLTTSEHDDGRCTGYTFSRIVFVLDKYLASTGGSESECHGHVNSWKEAGIAALASVRDRQTSLFGSIGIADVFGRPGAAALRKALRTDEGSDSGWTIMRSRGRFQVITWAETPRGQSGINQPLSLTPTTKQIGWHSSPVDWPAVQKAVPDATDAFRSERGDLLIVVGAHEIVAFTPSANGFGEAKLRIPLPETENHAVMAEWATGVYVQRWTMAVNMLARQAVPPVVPETPKR